MHNHPQRSQSNQDSPSYANLSGNRRQTRVHRQDFQPFEIEITVERWVASGAVFAKWEDKDTFKAVFVTGALPGEHVRVLITENKKDFAKGHVVQVLTASEYRVSPPCIHYSNCGGCDLQHLDPDQHQNAKTAMLVDTLKRQGGLKDEWLAQNLNPMVCGSPFAYRGRVRIRGDGSGHWGFLAAGSHQMQRIDQCLVMDQALQTFLQQKTDSRAIPPGEWRLLSDGQAVCTESSGRVLQVPVLDRKLWADAEVFFQSNRKVLELLIQNEVLSQSGGLAIDLFSGVGTFAAFLEDKFERVIAVERDALCLELAERNCPRTEFYTGAVEDWAVEFPDLRPDLLIVDPPRTGLPESILEIITKWNPKKWLYVSCDPVTLSRDIKRLGLLGWQVQKITPYDFYPQTRHLECVAWLEHQENTL